VGPREDSNRQVAPPGDALCGNRNDGGQCRAQADACQQPDGEHQNVLPENIVRKML
jgi:hypothetical protein